MQVIYHNLNTITKYQMRFAKIWQYNRYLDYVTIIIDENDNIKLLINDKVVATGVNNIKRILKVKDMKIEKSIIWD
ncbi:MAG: hypothetical protein ACLUWN_02675 [Clostridia bacterium]